MDRVSKRRSSKGAKMKKINLTLVAGVALGILMSGCGGNGYTASLIAIKDSTESSFTSVNYRPAEPAISKSELMGISADPQRYINGTCTRNAFLYLASRESLKRGYAYFAVADGPGKSKTFDNNMLGLPTVTNEAYNNYCNPQYNFRKSGLEHDKCEWRKTVFPLQMSTMTNTRIQLFKEKSYMFPTWDAKKTMEETRAKANACIDWTSTDWAGYRSDSPVHDINQTIVATVVDK